MKRFRYIVAVAVVCFSVSALLAKTHSSSKRSEGPLTPIHTTNTRGGFTIETVGDTLGQAKPENTRIILRIAGADKKLVKPAQINLVDKAGTPIRPVFREDRKVGHEENTGSPFSFGSQSDSSSINAMGVGVNLNKLFGPKGDYAYTKVDWPRSIFTADKSLQIVMPGGQTFVLPLTSLAN